jgi:hypothetical protein
MAWSATGLAIALELARLPVSGLADRVLDGLRGAAISISMQLLNAEKFHAAKPPEISGNRVRG